MMILTCFLFIFQFGIFICQFPLKYRMNEETEPGFILGNINSYVVSNFYEIGQYEVSLLNDYFSIQPNKDMIVKKRIDLEMFCNEANQCCGVSQCIVRFSVLIDIKNAIGNRFNVEIEVMDINDNVPTFKLDIQTVYIMENSNIGTQIPLEGGLDYDFNTANQIQTYKFDESSKTFELDKSEMASLNLILLKNIDYEKKNMYKARLSACDSNTRCKHQQIIININDDNDNFPSFKKHKYEINVPESTDVNKVLISARALDLDGPQFNKTKYDFYNVRDSNLLSKFKVNPQNGDIILISKLSAIQRLSYVFKISAMDGGQLIAGKRDIADVVINVLDINDNKPVIEVYETSKISNDKDSFEMKIKENEGPQKLMSLKVTDADLGMNAKVICELKDLTSSLEQRFSAPDLYEINSIRNFDYERETEINAIFECKDSGTPPLNSYKSIKIIIEDVNEYQPEFDKPAYYTSIKENTIPGITVLRVRATDRDGAAVLSYSIEESATRHFAINPVTGVIKTASTTFDRELISSKKFCVTVKDDNINPKSADTIVNINILDENDNDPIFVVNSLQFSILENQPPQTKLEGQLQANDNDQDYENRDVSFFLIYIFDSQLRKSKQTYFQVKNNGYIESLVELDRENNENFTLTVEARDKGNPQQITRANATVIIYDLNDNAPQWIYPRPPETRLNNFNALQMLNLTESTDRFLLIMKLKADDPDQNEAGQISYILVNHQESLFSLNDTTGELRTEKSPLPYGQYKLQLRAIDHGTPVKYSDSSILINIIDSGKLANINLTIIIGMVGITTLISIFLIFAIICVRRRPRFHQSYLAPSTDVSKEQSNQYFTQNQYMYHTTEETTMPPLSDNESFIYVPTNVYEQQDPLIMHSLTGSRPASRLDYSSAVSSYQVNNDDNKFASPTSQNLERSNTLRSNNGQYCSLNSTGIIMNAQELDGDSADSGKGASEVDLRFQQHLNHAPRNYPTMPFSHQSNATSTFGFQLSMPVSQYYSSNTNPRSFDSRFLTVNPSAFSSARRVMSPTFNSFNQCQCFMLPEDDVIQMGSDNEQLPMTSFSPKSMCNLKSLTYDNSCLYNNDIHLTPKPEYYARYPFMSATTTRLSPQTCRANNSIVSNQGTVDDKLDREKLDSYVNIYENKKINFSSSEQVSSENNMYTLELANC